MSQKPWHLNRRTFLRGTGVSLALPLLDGMSFGAAAKKPADLPRRMCCVYFPFGVALPPVDRDDADWNWFPKGEGRDFQFRNSLKPLDAVKNDVTVLGGMSHAAGRRMGGHDTGDIFLTGASFKGSRYANTISLDQFAAAAIGHETRFPSLTLSSDGGVGEPTRSTTLSFSRSGRPIPALAKPQQIFDRLFGAGDGEMAAQRRRLENSGSMLDSILEHARAMKGRLGKQDQRKLGEYLASVRAIEQRVAQSQKWLDIPKPEVDPKSIALAASPDGPEEYIRSMYDLLFWAFQTDTTRLATYMLGQVAGATTIANKFPACIGLGGNWHGLAHGGGKKGGAEKLGKFDQFLVKQLAYFLNRLKETPEGDGNLLDRTMVFYGSSNSRTHNNRNYPLLLAGGRGLGMKHGQYLKLGEKTPLSNVFVTMLDRLKVPVESFADSSGEMSELLT
jgi:hypothetical protein